MREATSRFFAYGRAVEAMRAAAVPEPHWYLAGIGVDPASAGNGIGGALMQPGLERSGADGVPLRAADEQRGEPLLLREPRVRGRPGGTDARRRAARLDDAPQAAYALPRRGRPKRFPNRDEIAAVRAEAEELEPGVEARRRAPARRAACSRAARWGSSLPRPRRPLAAASSSSARSNRTGEVDVHLGDIVGVTGHATKSRRGEPSLLADELEVLAHIRAPLPDTFHGLTDVEQRYRRRYLDLLMNEETRADFMLRARMVTAIRRSLDDEGFVEVETPVLQPRYGGAFARPFSTHHNELDQTLYLRIATELYLKRLIVGGLERVYEIGKDFRNEGVSFKHNPEFTMLEWYEAYADYRDTMDRMERLVGRVAEETLGTTTVTFRGHEIDLGRWQRVKLDRRARRAGLWTRDEEELRARLRAARRRHARTTARGRS